MTKKILLRLYLIFVLMTILSMLYFLDIVTHLSELNLNILISFFIIGLISLYNVLSSMKYEASLYKIHGYFFFIFMFLAPLYQYAMGIFPWGFIPSDNILLITNLILIIWLVAFILIYNSVNQVSVKSKELPANNIFIYLGFILTIIATILTIIDVGGISELFRRNSEIILDDTSSHLIFSKAIRPFPVLYLAYLIIIWKLRKSIPLFYLLFSLSVLFALVTNFPTGIARYQTGAVYLGLGVLLLKNKIKFDYLLLIGILVIFPTLNNFRYGEFDISAFFELEMVNYTTGHFDAYSMLARTIIYVLEVGPSYGYQLIGVFLFFIPRNIWPEKPLGSGYEVGMQQGLGFLNISSPIVAEAIINFGMVLFIIFPILIAYFIKKLDLLYWKNHEGTRYVNLYYVFLIGFSFFIIRGDLLSAFSYVIAFNFPIFILYVVTYFMKLFNVKVEKK